MRGEGQAVRELAFPSVDLPTPEQWLRLRQWRAELQTLLQRSADRLTGAALRVCVAEPEVGEAPGGDAEEREWAAAVAGDGERRWVLVAPPATGELLVAAALGLEPGQPGCGSVDAAVLHLMTESLVRAAWSATSPSRAAVVEGLPAGGACGAMAGLQLRYPVQLTVGLAAAEMRLVGSWAAWRPPRGGPTSPGGAGLTLDGLAAATVAVEAVLPGAEVGACDLLRLALGDVIPLGAATQGVLLRINGETVGLGRAGARGRHLAVNLVQVQPKKESEPNGG